MRRVLLVLAVLSGHVLCLPANAAPLPPIPPPLDGTEALFAAETLVYSERGSDGEIERLLDRADRAFSSGADGALAAYWRARVALLRGINFNRRSEDRSAVSAIRGGFALIETALTDGVFSDGLRVRADLHSQMMFARGLIYMVRNGDNARDDALRAREMEPSNTKAVISVAGFLLNAPSFAGGDPEEARVILEDHLASGVENVNDRYLILGWLARAAGEAGEVARAEAYLARAREIHGETAFVREIGASIPR